MGGCLVCPEPEGFDVFENITELGWSHDEPCERLCGWALEQLQEPLHSIEELSVCEVSASGDNYYVSCEGTASAMCGG